MTGLAIELSRAPSPAPSHHEGSSSRRLSGYQECVPGAIRCSPDAWVSSIDLVRLDKVATLPAMLRPSRSRLLPRSALPRPGAARPSLQRIGMRRIDARP
jgi:hypothetical protein